MLLQSEIKSFFEQISSLQSGDGLLVAFSGGPDSTALLWGLRQAAPDLGVHLHAFHVDHGLDGDSARRATRAQEICAALEVELDTRRCPIHRRSRPGENREAAARRVRYELLESRRQELGAAFIVTAHHADDQIETLVIRLLHGTGIAGLAGIQTRRQYVLRPLLGLRRQELRQALAQIDLDPVQDPSNLDLGSLRNRVRHLLLPQLTSLEPGLDDRLLKLATAAQESRTRLDTRLRQLVSPTRTAGGGAMDRRALENLPGALWPFALALTHREAAIAYPPSSAACQELQRQLAQNWRVGVDCGAGWRWESHGDQLTVSKPSPSTPGFAYTVEAPGECEILELGLRFRLRRGAVDTWMFRPSSRRAGLDLPIRPGDRVVVRSRRNGDRVRPFGCQYTRRLKDVLIDRQVPRQERDRIPLLEVDSRLAWIPGVTVDDTFRVEAGGQAWIAELESI